MTLLQAMDEYNVLINRWKKAEIYFAREDISIDEKISHAGECQKLMSQLSGLINFMRDCNYEMSEDEIDNGFSVSK